jgi:hypothetical protein
LGKLLRDVHDVESRREEEGKRMKKLFRVLSSVSYSGFSAMFLEIQSYQDGGDV